MSTIVVVQCDPTLNDGWCLALAEGGHVVLSAAGIEEGIERVREGGIDVVIVDDSRERRGLGRLVRELHKLPDAPPFVLVSSKPEAPAWSARLGAAAFLPKPCTAAELGQVVERIAPRQRATG